jgi:RP/EB family microtubule-associated protein
MTSGDNIGMMEGAFFVSKGIIINWINEFFCTNIAKIEQCATGAMYC